MKTTTFTSPANISWVVTVVPNGDHMLNVQGTACRGSTHFETRKIYLSCELLEPDMRIVLMHELTHAVLFDTQIESKEGYTEENMCDFVGMYGKYITDAANKIIEVLDA